MCEFKKIEIAQKKVSNKFILMKKKTENKTLEIIIESSLLNDCDDDLSSFASNTSSELNILRHDSNSLGVNSAQVGVLE